ncbi:MAG: serine hydroxymethyltransferase [Hyphomicrobiales bacterium]|nr:serine hydroxymethyltransferase [Hyphomicrobiales bacterium]
MTPPVAQTAPKTADKQSAPSTERAAERAPERVNISHLSSHASHLPQGNEAALKASDPAIFASIRAERARLQDEVELIASENIVSAAVLEAQGSIMTNKYAEGYPGRRYYGGCEHVDDAERLAVARACKLFDCAYANVQPHSGSQANQTVLQALLKPGDKILGMSLAAGGHLTHGAKPNQSGKWFDAAQYGVRCEDQLLDMEEVARLAHSHRPQLIIAGGSAYARQIDFAAFRAIADEVGAWLLVDMAHIAGLVAVGHHPSPLPHADVVTTTTHKTLRGPRGGLILAKTDKLAKKLNSALFPGLQGGPLMHAVAAKAVAFGEALAPTFRDYIAAVCANARALSDELRAEGFDLVSGGTDTHLCLLDVRPKAYTGHEAEQVLEAAHITCNKNAIPFDPQPPAVASGLRLGTPAATSRGFGEEEFRLVARLIARALSAPPDAPERAQLTDEIRAEIAQLTRRFPIYQ